MSSIPSYIQLDNDQVSLVIDCQTRVPTILYYGSKLSASTTPEMLTLLSTRQEAKCAPVNEPPIALIPSYGDGFTGAPGMEINGTPELWSTGATLSHVEQSQSSAILTCIDTHRLVKLTVRVELDTNTSIVTLQSSITNMSASPMNVQWFNSATIPLGPKYTKLKTFEGRWSSEFQTKDIDLFMGSYVRENRRGKTSHDTFGGLISYEAGTDEQAGQCIGFHLGTSGNHRMRAEMMADGRTYAQFGELLLPGEVSLEKDQSYSSPVLYMGYSKEGFSHLSNNFHNYIRANVLTHSVSTKARPVHYNTWEGIYFDHDVDTLKALADKVAPLGVERFVLDDGWFKGRRSDKAGLGDWVIDETVYPDGLTPLIEHVNRLGMEFGLWFEPEMVNPDSDLYRAHPEWVLQTTNNPQIPFRHQYVLDLSNPDVVEYLFNAVNDVLTAHPQIKYVKWDMNRDVNHQGGLSGQPAMHKQIQALYHLISRIKSLHPGLEIESCCSGGGRVDLGILQTTDRFWTSDSNDALDRLSIQRGFSFFFPAEVMGAHVGPRDCHITGRHIPIAMRAAVAMFGHMGIEMDPRELTEEETMELTQAIALHKENRELIHSGNLVRLNEDGLNINFGIVNQEKTQALFAYNSVIETVRTNPGRMVFAGLSAEQTYRVDIAWPNALKEYSPSIWNKIDGQVVSGDALMQFGMQMPVVFPQTALIFKLTAV